MPKNGFYEYVIKEVFWGRGKKMIALSYWRVLECIMEDRAELER